MIKRLMAVRILSGALLCGVTSGWALTAAQPHYVTVRESAALAILTRDTIQLKLPLTSPTGQNSRLVAELLSPTNTSSDETSVELPAGSNLASITLRWPTDSHGKPVTEIGWYRASYCIETAGVPVTRGILSIGAIAPNLMEIRIASPAKLVNGVPLSVRIYAGNPVTHKPFAHVRLEARLVIDAATNSGTTTNDKTLERQAITGRSGESIFTFPFPALPGQSATLTVTGTLSGLAGSHQALASATIAKDFEAADRTTIHVETDKPLHKPGEAVHLRALVLNDADHAAANTPISITIKDPEAKTILEAPLTTNRFGIASFDWKTTAQLAPGDYEASFDIDGSSDYSGSTSTTIRIQRYELPEFTVSAIMDKGYYLAGQIPTVRIHAGYLFGQPVAAGTVLILPASRNSWDPYTGKLKESNQNGRTATLDIHGDAELKLDVKDEFAELVDHDYERYRDLEFRAIVTDATNGRSEPRNFTVRITREPVHIYLQSEGGNDQEGDYLLTTTYADGTPAACKVTLSWEEGNFTRSDSSHLTTNRYGLARLRLHYPRLPPDKSRYSLRVIAQDAEGRDSKLDDSLYVPSEKGIWLSVEHTLLKPDQPIESIVHGPIGHVVDIDLVDSTGLLAHQQLHIAHAAEPVSIPYRPDLHGLVYMVAYEIAGEAPEYNSDWNGNASLKAFLYPEDRALKLSLSGLHLSYKPGATVDAALTVRDPTGTGSPSALGVAVLDTAVEQRAATEIEANDHWFGFNWWQNEQSVGGITLESLNRIDTKQPISEDLNLAAEALLLWPNASGIQIETTDSSRVRSEYESLIKHQLDPLGKTVLDARPEHLPATIQALQTIASAAKLEDAILVDPWNTPYKLRSSIQFNQEVVTLISAGPDKVFSTADDFEIELTRRNIFAIPGERLTSLLKDAATESIPLPGTLDGLKSLCLAHGLNLDTTLDSTGKPYHYAIVVRRRYYSVEVSMDPATSVWTSPSIDYFSSAEARIDHAIRDWIHDGNSFPDTVEDVRKAFTTAGLDFDALRDPTGVPFQLRSTQVLAYTRIERVKAGSSLSVQSKPVTHLIRAIQILRSSDKSAAENTVNDGDVVAQFLHPLTEQSGSDATPQAVDQGTFKGNTGAIGGTITDQTGAVIPNSVVEVKTSGGDSIARVNSVANGTYLVPDLEPGFYQLNIFASGFQTIVLREIHVSPVALTTIDIELRVGTAAETVEVTAGVMQLNTTSASVAVVAQGLATLDQKSHAKSPGGSATILEPTFTPRLRHVFEETAYWNPSLETTANGHANLHFTLPDSLTTWKLHALASTTDGRIGVIDQVFKTFQPFFLDLDAPQVLTVGDEITLPVNLRNYTDHALALPVTAKPADWFSFKTPSRINATVPSNGTTPILFGFSADKAVEAGPLNINAANTREGDAIEKTVRVHPDGEPRAVTASSLLHFGNTTLAINLPTDAVPGSIHADLLMYPNLGTHLLHSMKAVLERPWGCGEQTVSSTYPNLLFLELTKAAGSTSPLQAEAQNYLQLGYDRLLGYFDTSGGLTYWGGADHSPDPALTAYGIEFLTEASPYIKVDPAIISNAINWLVENQQTDSSWKPHYGDSNADLNLYIALILKHTLESSDFSRSFNIDLRNRTIAALKKAQAWAATSVAAAHDPYTNALRLRLASDDATKAAIRSELTETAIHDRQGAHWSNSNSLPFYSWGLPGNLETTANVLIALSRADASNQDRALVDDTLYYLITNKDRYGIWYSGQATVRVLQALMPLAVAELKFPATSQQFTLTINGTPLSVDQANPLHTDPHLLEAPRSLDLTTLLKPGHNELTFSSAHEAALASAEASVNFYVPWGNGVTPPTATTTTGTDHGLEFAYKCAAVNAHVGQPIDCSVSTRRFGSNTYGMLLAEVGLPPGADVDRASLAKLVDDWTISRYELQPDRIVFYLWSWRAEGTQFKFSFKPRYAIRAKAAPAVLFDYYNPDLKSVLAPQTFTVTSTTLK